METAVPRPCQIGQLQEHSFTPSLQHKEKALQTVGVCCIASCTRLSRFFTQPSPPRVLFVRTLKEPAPASLH